MEQLLKDTGFDDVATKTVQAGLVLPSARDALHLMQEAAGAHRTVVADLADEARSTAWDEVYECLKGFDSGSGFETQFEAVIGSGTNP